MAQDARWEEEDVLQTAPAARPVRRICIRVVFSHSQSHSNKHCHSFNHNHTVSGMPHAFFILLLSHSPVHPWSNDAHATLTHDNTTHRYYPDLAATARELNKRDGFVMYDDRKKEGKGGKEA